MAGGMAQPLRELAALSGEMSSIPKTYMAQDTHLVHRHTGKQTYRENQTPSWKSS